MTKRILLTLIFTLLAAALLAQVDSTDVMLRRGGKALMDNDFTKARQQYEAILDLHPDHAEALRGLGVVHSATGDQNIAKELFEKSYALEPDNAEVCNNLGVIYSQAGDRRQALKYFSLAVRLDSTDVQHLNNLAGEQAKVGKCHLAFPLLERAMALDSLNPLAPFLAGNCHSAANRFDSSEFYYERSRDAGGETAVLFYRLGIVKRNLGKHSEAETNLKEAVKRNPRHRDAYQSLGLLYTVRQKYVTAIAQFNQVVSIDSLYMPGWIALGVSYALIDDLDHADTVMYRLLQTDSAYAFQMVQWIQEERARTIEGTD